MQLSVGAGAREAAVVELFSVAFTASEGVQEGARIGQVAREMLSTTASEDLGVVQAHEGQRLIGCACFSRLWYDDDPRTAYVLSPVAVHPDNQGRGLGQQLLRHGLEAVRGRGADVVLVYGDPAYYSKVGFRPIPEASARAPYPLSHPQGWQAQPLGGTQDFEPLMGASRCVPALAYPELW